MIANIDLYISIVVTVIVVGVPFFVGAHKAIERAVNRARKAHKSELDQIVSGINAAIKYYKKHPTEDKEIEKIIAEIARIVGVAVPDGFTG